MGAPAVTAPTNGSSRRPSRRGIEARAALVAAAERLFAERGIEAVSLRDVSAAAGQRNHSAAQYHFGDRRGLVAAVYEVHMTRVDARRRQLVADLDDHASIEALVGAFVLPFVEEVTATAGWYARFLVRTRWDPTALDVVTHLDAASALITVGQRLLAELTHLPPARRESRLDQLLNLVISTLATWEWAHDRGDTALGPSELAADLTATGTAVLLAPTPAGVRP